MDPIKIIIPAITVLAIVLIVLLVFLYKQIRKDAELKREIRKHTSAAQPVMTPRSTHTPAPINDPAIQQARRALESPTPGIDEEAEERREAPRQPLRANDRTPAAGNPRVEISNLLNNEKDDAPRWLNDALRAPEGEEPLRKDLPTAPHLTVDADEDDSTAAPAPAGRHKGTVALARPFFEEEKGGTKLFTPSATEENEILATLQPTPTKPAIAPPPARPPVASSPATSARPSLPPRPGAAGPRPIGSRTESPARTAMNAALNRPLATAIPKHNDAFGAVAEEIDPNAASFRDTQLAPAQRLEAFQQLLRKSENEERVLLVIEAMNDDNLEIQLYALQEINSRSAGDLLDEVIPLVDAPNPKVAIAAIKALETIGGPVVDQTLLAALDSNTDAVRAEARRALVASATPLLEEQLQEMLAETGEQRIEAAAAILAGIGGNANAELLETRASLLHGEPALAQKLRELASKSRETVRTNPDAHASFANALEIDFEHTELDEFALSLDPELFNPKSQ